MEIEIDDTLYTEPSTLEVTLRLITLMLLITFIVVGCT